MSAPAPARSKASRYNGSRLITGVLVLLFGLGWLVQALGVFSRPWDVLLPVGLILIGAAVVWNARAGRRSGGLGTLGVILTLVLLVGSAIHVPLAGGVGERTYHPESFDDLDPTYELAAWSLRLGLRQLPALPDASRTVRVRLGAGQVTVHVGTEALLRVRTHVGVGRVLLFDRSEAGFGVDLDSLPKVPAPVPTLTLDVYVGAGQIRVIRG
jgi:hypothetical protein